MATRNRSTTISGDSRIVRPIARLLGHRVARTAAVYAAVLFPLLEGVQTIVGSLGLPEILVNRLVVVSLAGFPVALILAWLTGGGAPVPAGAGGRAGSRGVVLRASAVVTVAIAAVAGSAWLALRPVAPAPIRTIAVLPLANWMGDPAQDYFVEGMHDALISELAAVSELTVIARTSVERYRQTTEPVSRIAGELGVDAIIEGSVFRAGDSVRINVSVVRGESQETLASESVRGSVRDALDLQRTVTRRIAEMLRVNLSDEQIRRLSVSSPVDPVVHELYLRGRAQWRTRSKEGLAKAITLLEAAVAEDPGFAPAYAALADAYTVARGYGAIDMPWSEAYARAGGAAERALELDPVLPEAHASLAFLRFQSDRDIDAAERGLRRSVELNPSNAQALGWLSALQRARGRSTEAIALARRARALDPFAPVMNRYLAFTLARTGHCDEAMEYAQKAIDLAPDHADGYLVPWSCHALAGRYDQAVTAGRAVLKAWGLSAEDLAAYDTAFREHGWEGALRFEVELLEARRVPVRTEYFIAQRLALMGEVDDALLALERAWIARDPILIFELRLDPLIESVRSDPRYRSLVERAGLAD